ncbi:hypothetical protein H0H87_009949 [Tephrocybe sp. NHM501043]|nr:hypothetical protein H0H87_009949 [Tephrocybe sp. NHM501043]
MVALLAGFALASLVTCALGQDGYASLNGGTTGGSGGTTTTVSAAAAFQTAIKTDTAKTVYLKGPISLSSQAAVGKHPTMGLVPAVVAEKCQGNNTSIIGVGTSGVINGGGLKVNGKSNVIIRNLVINKVVGNDAITVQHSNNVWIDHNEFYSDTTHGFDYYDGQVDVTHAFTVRNVVSTYGFVIPDDSPIDPAGDFEPDGFANLGAGESILFMFHMKGGAYQLSLANDFGTGKNNITAVGNFTSVPYSYTLTPLANVRSTVTAGAGISKI